MNYKAPLADMRFLFDDVLCVDNYSNVGNFAEAAKDARDQILDEAAKFCETVLAPLNEVGDKQGCKLNPDHTVTVPDGFTEAYHQFVAAGWPLLGADPAFGGAGLPRILNVAISEMVSSSNMAFGMYPGLTHGAYAAIHAGGTDEQKALYLPKLASGEWAGTMNLTEPHCGTDLGLLRTKAVPQLDGTYAISGQKIWISGGEHSMTDNHVHLVLGRIEGAPAGVKGISLFIVPKYLVNADGSLGERNKVQCVGLEEKMGIHGNATCVMAYEEATGYLIGEAHRGLQIMFVMMNEARLGVGLQGMALGEVAYQHALAFAKDRRQGRALTGPKEPDHPADNILAHPDVRRMLMDVRALTEGGRAFLYWTALWGDLSHDSPDDGTRQKGNDFMALLTPVLKAYLTDKGHKNASDALQVHGGSGFTEHYRASQFLRDSKIAMIYEGTNGIQALDLVGRKLAANGGRGIQTFLAEIDSFLADHKAEGQLAPFHQGLSDVRAALQEATLWLMANGMANFDNAGAAGHDYVHIFGLTALTFMWAKMAQVSIEKAGQAPIYATKLKTGQYFIDRILPEYHGHLAKLKSGAASMMAYEVAEF